MKCFACGKALGKNPHKADTLEDQWVFVGIECYKLIVSSGKLGYLSPKKGIRLYKMTQEREEYFRKKGI